MRRTALLVAALVVVGTGVPLVAGLPTDTGDSDSVGAVGVQDDDAANDTENETPPGAQLVGVVNVQAADVEGDLSSRSFGLQLAAAESNASKAAVLANQTGALDDRLDALRDRKQRLVEARENGTISEARFRAEMTGLAAELSAANRLVEQAGSASEGVPAADLEAHGVNATELDRLRQAAGNLSGPEISAIARGVAGPSVNVSVGPPGNVTPGPASDVDFPAGVSAEDLPEDVSVEDLPEDVSVEDLPEDVSASDLRTLASDPSDDEIEEILGGDDGLGDETDDDETTTTTESNDETDENETDDGTTTTVSLTENTTVVNTTTVLGRTSVVNTAAVPLSLHSLLVA